jgi:polar amino acid transport system substrate-binding protein
VLTKKSEKQEDFMKKIVSLLIIAIMVVSMVACKKNDSDEDKSLQYIKDNGKLILGLDDAFAPMGFRDENNNIVGFDIDLAQAVCDKLGVELVLQPVEWETKENELNTKNIDCIWNGLSLTPARIESMTMSEPYLTNDISLVVTSDSDIKSLEDMAGKKLALQSSSSAEDALNSEDNKSFKESLSEVIPFSDYEVALLDLESGNSDAVLLDTVVADYKITAGKDLVKIEGSLLPDQYAIGFRKGDEALCDAVEAALKELKAEGTVAEISTKWFGADITIIK